MKFIKEKITLENILVLFVLLCPILDMASFIFRNKFNTNISISTFIRPVIPIIVFAILFFKEKTKNKLIIIIICLIYFLYGLIHIIIYNNMKTACSFGTLLHEMQYIVNYSFMILNLFIFMRVFNKKNRKKLQNSILISMFIYIVSIYIAIITKTSSSTYIEGIGYKGWFESGNSISAILLLGTFIIMSFILNIKGKKVRIFMFSILILIGLFLTTLIGTRVGLFGFIISILCFVFAEVFCKIVKNIKISNKIIIVSIGALMILVLIVSLVGSITVQRRKHLQNMENTIIDVSNGQVSNLTGDLTNIKNKIINNELEENFMNKEQQSSVLDLYNIAQNLNIDNTNTRMQQLIYHCELIKNQSNIVLILFGNGYLINTNELVLEMEFPAILFNFGIFGFVLYMIPFIIISVRALKKAIKNVKKIDTEFIMLFLAASLSFALSTLSGYVFFNSSLMIIIIIINVLLEKR